MFSVVDRNRRTWCISTWVVDPQTVQGAPSASTVLNVICDICSSRRRGLKLDPVNFLGLAKHTSGKEAKILFLTGSRIINSRPNFPKTLGKEYSFNFLDKVRAKLNLKM
jgi:hypothetical protein